MPNHEEAEDINAPHSKEQNEHEKLHSVTQRMFST
jgi:hypothetical protein